MGTAKQQGGSSSHISVGVFVIIVQQLLFRDLTLE